MSKKNFKLETLVVMMLTLRMPVSIVVKGGFVEEHFSVSFFDVKNKEGAVPHCSS